MSKNAESVPERIEVEEGAFGLIVQLWRGNVLVDTYCSWNGDPRPAWLDAAQIDGSGAES